MNDNPNDLEENKPLSEAEPEGDPQKLVDEQVRQWFFMIQNVLIENFPDYLPAGNIGLHPEYGTLFSYQLFKDGKAYSCGFILKELVERFMNNNEPELWLCSFFYDKIDNEEAGDFPKPPTSEDEFKDMVDNRIVPMCVKNIREEFPDYEVHIDLEVHPDLGPVLESGFPHIQEGNNTSAMPLMYLITMYMLNRDPSEPIISALSRILDEHKAAKEE
jgi:hypothetical protein